MAISIARHATFQTGLLSGRRPMSVPMCLLRKPQTLSCYSMLTIALFATGHALLALGAELLMRGA